MLAECIALGLFLAGLGLCIVTGIQILYALLFGLLCFSVYCLAKGYSARETGSMLWEGISQVRNILIIFVFIGGLTAVWRISGTIPYILYYAVGFIHPRYFVLCTFLLCSSMSFLTGTSFGTASTMGVICMLISNAADLSPFLTGGAILSGSFFGDRCSPMSSSAQLICSLTRTDIYQNIKLMCRSSAVPLAVTCILYVVLASGSSAPADRELLDLFRTNFSLHWAAMLPAVLILVLSLLRVDVKYAMAASIAAGAAVALFVQGTSPLALLRCFLSGYEAQNGTRLAQLLNGGGIRSMVKVGIIVLISASYSGIFSHTCLLSGVKHALLRSARRLTPFLHCSGDLGPLLCGQLQPEPGHHPYLPDVRRALPQKGKAGPRAGGHSHSHCSPDSLGYCRHCAGGRHRRSHGMHVLCFLPVSGSSVEPDYRPVP